MKNIRIKYCRFPFGICLLMFTMFFFLPNGDALAQNSSRKKAQNLEVKFSLASVYDNNILKYSEKYLDKFRNSEDEGRFHINTYDDVILQPSMQVTWTFHIFGKLASKINGDFSYRAYMVNNIKNWNYMSVGFRQYFTKRGSIKLFYSYIPDFYVRHFRDDDWVDVYGYTPETFQPFGFSKDNFGIWVQNTFFKNTKIRFSLYYSRYFYNKHFTEYDSKNFLYGMKLYQPINKKLKLVVGYQFITSDAKGYDEPHETKENSDDSDASFKEDRFLFGFNLTLPRLLNHHNHLDVECGIRKRHYSSEHYLEQDCLHAGRVDDIFRLGATYNIKLNKKLKLSAFYYWFQRNSSTTAEENKKYVSAEKDYRQYQLGLEVTYKLKY